MKIRGPECALSRLREQCLASIARPDPKGDAPAGHGFVDDAALLGAAALIGGQRCLPN